MHLLVPLVHKEVQKFTADFRPCRHKNSILNEIQKAQRTRDSQRPLLDPLCVSVSSVADGASTILPGRPASDPRASPCLSSLRVPRRSRPSSPWCRFSRQPSRYLSRLPQCPSPCLSPLPWHLSRCPRLRPWWRGPSS